MKKFSSIIFLLFPAIVFSQSLRVSLGTGISNYSGDIQQKYVTTQGSKMMFSTGASIDLNNHLLVRADVSFTNLGADDKNNLNPALTARNLNFKTSLVDYSLVAEYSLLSLQKYKLTPYIFAGIGAFHFNPFTTDSAGGKIYLKPLSTEGQGLSEYPDRENYKLTQFNIPYGAGIKWAVSDDLHLGMEMSLRKIFTDYVDDVSTNYVDKDILLAKVGTNAVSFSYRGDELKNQNLPYPSVNSIRGNSSNNDAYYFARIRLELRMAWLSNEDVTSGSISSNRKSLRCPF